MCAPAAAPIALGVAQAGAGALSAFGQYQSQVDATNSANQAALRDYQYQQQRQAFQRQQMMAIREAQTQQYERNKTNIYEALGLNYNAAQRQLDNAYRSAFYEEQNEAMQLAKSLGRGSTKGLTGVTAQRMDTEVYQERGRNQAIRQQNLQESGYRYEDETRMMRTNAYSDVLRAYEPVSTPLMFGPSVPQPVYQSQPNRLGLYSGLLGAGLSGVQTGMSFFK